MFGKCRNKDGHQATSKLCVRTMHDVLEQEPADSLLIISDPKFKMVV